MNILNVNELCPNIYHFVFRNQYVLTATMMRIQEYYESSYEEIQGKFFKYEQYMDLYAERNNGKFSYYTDWSGFNVPGCIVRDFFRLFSYDFIIKERDIYEAIKAYIPNWHCEDRKYYIIATYKDSKHKASEKRIIEHEMAHGLWHTNDSYEKNMKLEILKFDKKNVLISKKIKENLIKMGYSKDVANDEMQAYLSTSTLRRIGELFDVELKEKDRLGMIDVFEKFTRNNYESNNSSARHI